MFLKSCKFLYFRSNFYSTTTALNSAQFAFLNRIGINDEIPQSKLLVALSHPKLKRDQINSDSDEFLNLIKIGHNSLYFFSREYLITRFPNLDEKYLKIGVELFLEDKNILKLAQFIGIDAACGIDSVEKNNYKTSRKISKKNTTTPSSSELLSEKFGIQLDCFKALIGLIGVESGPLKIRNFLDSRYFNNSLFNPNDLVRPLYPIPDLTKLYPNLVFRLHQESGRLSSNSIFIIGVYQDASTTTCLGEGHGASQALAQLRASTEALRNFNLTQKRILNRPSDLISSISDMSNPISHK